MLPKINFMLRIWLLGLLISNPHEGALKHGSGNYKGVHKLSLYCCHISSMWLGFDSSIIYTAIL